MPRIKVLIADSLEGSRKVLKDILERLGYQVVAEAATVPDLLRKVRMTCPQVVIMDPNLGGGNVIEAAHIIEEDDLSAPVLLVNGLDNPEVRNFHYCFKPVAEGSLIAAVDASVLHRSRIRELRREVTKLRETLENRKTLEKAKGILMKNLKLDEEEAYRLMQRQSMNKGVPMVEIAKAIILAYEVGRDMKSSKGE